MSGPSFSEAAKAYWTALGRQDALPELPEEPFDAFIEILDLGAMAPNAFTLVEYGPTPYPQLLLGDRSAQHAIQWAVELSELEPFVQSGAPELTFLADSHADPVGKHRVYTLEDGIRGMLEFPDVADALMWMSGKVEATGAGGPVSEEASRLAVALDDPWEDSNSSGFFILETLLDLPFAEAWDSYSRGEWPVVDTRVPAFRFRRQGPWQRSLALHLVHRFLVQRIVDLPRSIKPNELGKALRALTSHLQAFEEAMAAGMAPAPIDALSDSGEPKFAKLAREWVQRHEAWRESLGKPVPGSVGDGLDDDLDNGSFDGDGDDDDADADADDSPDGVDAALAAVIAKVLGRKPGVSGKTATNTASDFDDVPVSRASKKTSKAFKAGLTDEAPPEATPEADTPFLKTLRVALTAALDGMIEAELLDLDAGRKPALLAELIEAGANARSAAHLLKSLTDTIVNSDHVEEVYATDDEVERFIRRRLEQR